MELVFILIAFKVRFIYLFKIVKVIGTFGVNAFMDYEVLPVLLMFKGV